jgi:adenylate cyclase class 2
MQYEVEQKFHIKKLDLVSKALEQRGSQIGDANSQIDVYFSHPAKDFGKTDEALRLRIEGESGSLTYKGPKVDSITKSRLELELALPSGQEQLTKFRELLTALGFEIFLEIKKERRKALVDWLGTRIEVSLDQVEGLGVFVELETAANEAELPSARGRIASLAHELGLQDNERLSYCELMMKRRESLVGDHLAALP